MKRISAAALLLILCLILSSCSALSLEPEDLLVSPGSAGEESEIISLIGANVTRSYELIYPLSGENKGAVTVGVIDSSGSRIAVALFRDKKDPASAAILFARDTDGHFSYIGGSFIPTSLIDRVDFADIDGDSVKEILIGYQGASSFYRSVALYDVEDGITIIDIPAVYNGIVYGDFDADGADEALCIKESSSDETAKAVLMGYHPSSGLSEISYCEIDSDISGIVNLKACFVSEDDFGAVLDTRTSSGEYATQILYFDSSQRILLNPLLIYDKYRDTKRTAELLSKDVDSDGVTEIPLCSLTPHAEGEDESTVCEQVEWASFDIASMTLYTKKTAILSKDGVYSLSLSGEQKGAVTARFDGKDRVTGFFVWDEEKDEIVKDSRLLYIKAYSKETFNQDRIIERKLCELSSDIYAYLITRTDSPYAFSDSEVEKGFELL